MCVAGAGVYVGGTSWTFTGKCWGQVFGIGETEGEASHVVRSTLGPLWSVQHAENCAGEEGRVPTLPRLSLHLINLMLSELLVSSPQGSPASKPWNSVFMVVCSLSS